MLRHSLHNAQDLQPILNSYSANRIFPAIYLDFCETNAAISFVFAVVLRSSADFYESGLLSMSESLT